MSEERPKGFLSRVFGPPGEEEDERTSVYSSEDFRDEEEYHRDSRDDARYEEEDHIEETGGSFTVERAAEIIRHLPPEVPRSSAVRIVRQTLVAAGINIEDLATSTRARDSKLNSEINLRRQRIKELQEKTENVVRDLEGQIRRAREARDTGIANEERRISSAEDGLEDVEHVRDFFSLPKGDAEYEPSAEESKSADDSGDETQIIERVESEEEAPQPTDETQEEDDETRVIRGPLSERWESEKREDHER